MNANDMTYPLVSALSRIIYSPSIIGAERIPKTGGALLVANHLSFAENMIIPAVAGRAVRFIVKSEYLQGTGIGGRIAASLFRAWGSIPIEREGASHSIAESLNAATTALREGKCIAMYPEGTRSPDGRLYKGKVGAARLALESNAPVIPIGISGTEKMQPIGRRLPRRTPVTLSVGMPLYFSKNDYTHTLDDWRKITGIIMSAIQEQSGQEYVDRYKNEAPRAAERRSPKHD